jgi:hypothetical protein
MASRGENSRAKERREEERRRRGEERPADKKRAEQSTGEDMPAQERRAQFSKGGRGTRRRVADCAQFLAPRSLNRRHAPESAAFDAVLRPQRPKR